ncbi:zinc finger protein OZF-like [Penaeus japonicus]|uniref:zinc finger protein OZF-like n=1 Tax=Penaeus japonicus TaxID=27405 RepID=UPI001C71754F|nr:zinc finger protein OZF-like [Penaeus japonicus]
MHVRARIEGCLLPITIALLGGERPWVSTRHLGGAWSSLALPPPLPSSPATASVSKEPPPLTLATFGWWKVSGVESEESYLLILDVLQSGMEFINQSMDISKATMNFMSDWLPLVPLRDEEIYGAGVAIKEEASEGVTEETCVEIKEESLDYADEARYEVSEATIEHGFPFYKDLKKEDFERDSSNVTEDSNNALPTAPFVAEDFGPKGSSDEDQAAYRESNEELLHRKNDEKRKGLVCELCGKKFLSKSKLKTHMRVHTKEKPYSCEVCEKTFSQKQHLVTHMRVHTEEKPYSCEVCKKAFSQKPSLLTHMRAHTKEKPYSCEDQAAHREGNEEVPHRNCDVKKKRFVCDLCGMIWFYKSLLARHMRVHTKERPYSCEVCEKAFSEKPGLVTHMRVHTKEKPYSCEVCGKAFSEKHDVVKHL